MCWEMCKGSEINSPEPLPGGIWANGRSFHVWNCAGIRGKKLRCPSLEGYGPMDGVPMSRIVQGSVDKNSRAPPWRDTGQRTEFPCPASANPGNPCRDCRDCRHHSVVVVDW